MKNKKLSVVGLILSFIPVICLIGLFISITTYKNTKESEEVKTNKISVVGIIVSIIMLILSISLSIYLINYRANKEDEARRYEIYNIVYEALIATSEQYRYDLETGNIEDNNYHVYNINNLNINTKKELNNYYGYIAIDATEYDYEYYVFIYSSVYQVLNYPIMKRGAISPDSDYINKFDDTLIPHDIKDVCRMIRADKCYNEEGILIQ